MTRNCIRCGDDFESGGGTRICGECASTAEQKKPLNMRLSLREKQVVALVCKARLNKQIATELHLTEGTIKQYMHRIFQKLGVSSRTELAVWAHTAGACQLTDFLQIHTDQRAA